MTELLSLRGLSQSVRVVNLAGEPLRSSLVRQIYQYPNVERVFNLYGPSEDTTYSTAALMANDSDAAPTIGRPIANTQIYLLDSQLEPVAIGATAELYIGGDGLARGYLGRAGMTADRFIPDRFSAKTGARLYRTGDLARYRDNGEIEFLGRKDNQVKIRGYRIELGEIEAVLSKHPAILDTVVCARDDSREHKKLVAFVVYESNQNASAAELRSFLKSRLPDHLVPTIFIPLAAMPALPNGKIDRNALPELDNERPATLEKAYVAPRTFVEEQLSQIWARLLKLEKVGIHDNFFELGGSSLSGIQVIAQLKKEFDVPIPTVSLYEGPTVSALVKIIHPDQAEAEVAYDESRSRGERRREKKRKRQLSEES